MYQYLPQALFSSVSSDTLLRTLAVAASSSATRDHSRVLCVYEELLARGEKSPLAAALGLVVPRTHDTLGNLSNWGFSTALKSFTTDVAHPLAIQAWLTVLREHASAPELTLEDTLAADRVLAGLDSREEFEALSPSATKLVESLTYGDDGGPYAQMFVDDVFPEARVDTFSAESNAVRVLWLAATTKHSTALKALTSQQWRYLCSLRESSPKVAAETVLASVLAA